MLKRTMTSALLTSVITAIIFGVVLFTYVDNYKTVYTYLSVDINPSIAIELNKQNSVIRASALNDDAKVLALNQMEGVGISDAINMFVEQAGVHNFIEKNADLYITAVSLKENAGSYDAFKMNVFDKTQMAYSLTQVDISFAESDIDHYTLSRREHKSLKNYTENASYNSIVAPQLAQNATRYNLKMDSEDGDKALLIKIDKFLSLIEQTHKAQENGDVNFVLLTRARLQESSANYHDIYRDVIAYWDELNDTIRMQQIASEISTSMAEVNLQTFETESIALGALEESIEPTTTLGVEKTTVQAYTQTETAVITTLQPQTHQTEDEQTVQPTTTAAATTESIAVDMGSEYDVDAVKENGLSHAQAVDDFFNDGLSISSSNDDETTAELETHPEVKNKIKELQESTPTSETTTEE